MSNPYFSSNPVFSERSKLDRTPNGYPAMPGYTPGATATSNPDGRSAEPAASAYPAPSIEELNATYAQRSASPTEMGRMTYDDAIVKSVLVIGTIVLTAAVHWFLIGPSMGLMFLGLIGGLVLGLVNAFKREPSPVLIMGYAVTEGLFLGGISAAFEAQWGGIVMQAVLATSITFLVCLGLYRSGTVRVTAKSTRILLIAMLGYMAFSLVNLLLMWTGISSDPWGLRGMTIMGIPLGVIIGVGAVILASYSLIVDFDAIERGVRRGVPQRYSWAAAFGLAVTLVWLYLEFLRLLAILRD
ncbi:MAG: Bax inhibitor-1/YccA family protein [Bowdeniella nasicola]|nr:Bax inhibitor-1/YccA family protein [Bowdeniella nasicola]